GGERLVGQVPDLARADLARDLAVVEQRGVGGEALLAHELLVVEPAVVGRVLRVPLGRDAAHRAVIGHDVSTSSWDSRDNLHPTGCDRHHAATRVATMPVPPRLLAGLVDDAAVFPPGSAPLSRAL